MAKQQETSTPEVISFDLPKVAGQPVDEAEEGTTRGKLWGSTAPLQETLKELLSSDLSEVLSMSARAQVRIPKSMLTLVESVKGCSLQP